MHKRITGIRATLYQFGRKAVHPLIMHKRFAGILISTCVMLLAVLAIGPLDLFTHGFYCEEPAYDLIKYDLKEPVSLEDGDYEMQFSPVKDHFNGISINITNQPEGNQGRISVTVLEPNRHEVDAAVIDLSKVTAESWYKVRFHKRIRKGKTYTLKFSAYDCAVVPCLQTIDADYLHFQEESVSGNMLISYAYAESTFTFANKIVIVLFLFAVWILGCSRLLNLPEAARAGKCTGVVLFLTALLSWNYMYNSMDSQNTAFDTFQSDSEALATGVIMAERMGVWFDGAPNFGLGSFSSFLTYYTDDTAWFQNYSRTEPAVVVNANDYARTYAVKGNYILFENEDALRITEVSDDGSLMLIRLAANRILNPYKYGTISQAVYCDHMQKPLARLNSAAISPYRSQFGLQGKVFRHLARYMDEEDAVENLHLLCSLATAFVFAVITVLLAFKYNHVFAVVFLVTFWLSPWVVNFARNLYWVEFTWFIPMAVGLFCSIRIEYRKCRMLCYAAAFCAVMGKCLCGYEYISSIMMGLIAFLLTDLVKELLAGDKQKAILLFRTIFILGVIALAGFMAAICVHAPLKGNGSILAGIKDIVERDVLRRTNGADLNELGAVYWPSLNASVWDTYRKYFHFGTEIVTGIAGNLFPLLCISPLCIFGYEMKNKEADTESMAMYAVFFLTAISWFCLAKGHSYIHTHMNYVLWYFGFVQICFYVMLRKLQRTVMKKLPDSAGYMRSNEVMK